MLCMVLGTISVEGMLNRTTPTRHLAATVHVPVATEFLPKQWHRADSLEGQHHSQGFGDQELKGAAS
jgi:hypothetical protein